MATKERKVCFGGLQNQRWTPNSIISLCDAMDLLIVGTNLRRTMNWEQNNLGILNGDVFAWHEKYIASAKGLTVSLYSLEGILAAENETEQEEMAKLATIDLADLAGDGDIIDTDDHSVTQMRFCVATKPHKNWIEQEENEKVCDLITANSPVVDYSYLLEEQCTKDDTPTPLDPDFTDETEAANHLADMPTNQSRLSVLAVTTSKRLYLFAYGRYPLGIHLPIIPSGHHQLALSHDLAHAIVTADHRLMFYTSFEFSCYRNELQVLASQYPRIFAQLDSMKASVPDIVSSWKISLKAMNLKMEAFVKILRNYGGKTELGPLLARYIMLRPQSPEEGNAVDQFFTGNQMNDQLVIRMERSLQSALANIQETVKTKIVEPAQQLIKECQTIWGLTATGFLFSRMHGLSDSLLESSFAVWTAAQKCQAQLLQDQRRLTEDWVPWLRSMAAQIKANGTAAKSVQRQNAIKRRVNDIVVKRVVNYLKEGRESSRVHSEDRSLIEHILNLDFASSMHSDTTTSLPAVLDTAHDWATQLFRCPRSQLSFRSTALSLLPSDSASKIASTAVVTRMDGDGHLFGERLSSLVPRQWCVTATPLSQTDCLLLHAIPLTSPDSTKQKGVPTSPAILGDKVLSCRLQFPHPIVDVSFYSDDGRSSFANERDTYGEEGERQKLGLLLQAKPAGTSQDNVVELWLLRYDDLPFEVITLKSEMSDDGFESNMTVLTELHRSSPVPVSPLANDEAEDVCFNGTSVAALTRPVTMKRRETPMTDSKLPATPSARLLLSGPRGVGAIHSATANSGSTLDIFDLEDNEDDDSDDEDRETSMEVE